ncbi:MAG: hypothetical protein K0S00_2873 [Xanthobacteraceae bacterium]|nr:hypothetical protein [Xanthobacteraceae bacterium]
MKLLRKAFGYIVRPFGLRDRHLPGYDGGDSHAGERITVDSVLALSTAWACVNLLAGTMAALPIDVQRNRDGRPEDAGDHPLARVLRDSPNADQTPIDFWEFMCISLELWGNAYALIERSGERIVSLEPIRPDLVTVRRRADGELEYRWSEGGLTPEVLLTIEAEDYRDRPVTIYDVYFHPDTGALLHVQALKRGYIDTIDHIDDPEDGYTLEAKCESRALDYTRTNGRRRTVVDQARRAPGDLFFEHAAMRGREVIFWGREKAAAPRPQVPRSTTPRRR